MPPSSSCVHCDNHTTWIFWKFSPLSCPLFWASLFWQCWKAHNITSILVSPGDPLLTERGIPMFVAHCIRCLCTKEACWGTIAHFYHAWVHWKHALRPPFHVAWAWMVNMPHLCWIQALTVKTPLPYRRLNVNLCQLNQSSVAQTFEFDCIWF